MGCIISFLGGSLGVFCFNCWVGSTRCNSNKGENTKGVTARFGSLFLLAIGTILIFICLMWGYEIFKNEPFDMNVGQCVGSFETCVEKHLVIKIGVALALFFLLHLVLSFFAFCDSTLIIHEILAGFWLIKLFVFGGILVGCYYIPPQAIVVLFYFTIVGSACFLVFQVYLLIKFLTSLNTSLVKDDKKLILYSGFVLGILLFGGIIGVSYGFFSGCSLNVVFTSVAVVLAAIMMTITCFCHSVSSSIFTTALIMAYCAYLNLSTLLANPDTRCVNFHDMFGGSYKPSMLLGMGLNTSIDMNTDTNMIMGRGMAELELSNILKGMDSQLRLSRSSFVLPSSPYISLPSLSSSSFSLSSSVSSSSLSAILSSIDPDSSSSLNDNPIDIVFKVISIIITFLSLLYSAFSATGVTATSLEKIEDGSCSTTEFAGSDDESQAVRDVSYWKLNLVMILASLHVVAVVCGWGFHDVSALGGLQAGIGNSAMGFKCATHYLCVIFYIWVLTNPYVGPLIFPGREWPSKDVG